MRGLGHRLGAAYRRQCRIQCYSIGLQKGAENGSSSLSLSWLDHDGIVKGTDFQRLNSRFSSDYGFLDNRLKAGGNVAVNWWTAHYMPGGIEENAVKQHPAKAVYDTEGVYVDQIYDILGDTPNAMRLIDRQAQPYGIGRCGEQEVSQRELLRLRYQFAD